MRTIRVDLGDRSYDTLVGIGLLQELERLVPVFPHSTRSAVITDGNVEAIYGSDVVDGLTARGAVDTFVVEPGEASKSWPVAQGLLDDFADNLLRRDDPLFTLGGGVVVDLGGFVASVYQRGLPLVHLPTTLLAQVDAAIGGKTGVNLSAGKNLAGTFYQPALVVADVATLTTLPPRELRSGLAEVAKYGFCFDAALVDDVVNGLDAILSGDTDLLGRIVARCVEIKAGLVSQDERDQSDRAVLNYGHTFAHALESLSGYGQWLHGEAVSIGMVFAAALGRELGILTDSALERHMEVLQRIGLPIRASFGPDEIMARWRIDKKHRSGQRWVLLKDIGEAVVVSDVEESAIRKALARVIPE